jgi:hypothetical protein
MWLDSGWAVLKHGRRVKTGLSLIHTCGRKRKSLAMSGDTSSRLIHVIIWAESCDINTMSYGGYTDGPLKVIKWRVNHITEACFTAWRSRSLEANCVFNPDDNPHRSDGLQHQSLGHPRTSTSILNSNNTQLETWNFIWSANFTCSYSEEIKGGQK